MPAPARTASKKTAAPAKAAAPAKVAKKAAAPAKLKAATKDSAPAPSPARDIIARLAYAFAEARGFAPGKELDDWLAAEARYEAMPEGERLAAL
jgi:hypothetical protein